MDHSLTQTLTLTVNDLAPPGVPDTGSGLSLFGPAGLSIAPWMFVLLATLGMSFVLLLLAKFQTAFAISLARSSAKRHTTTTFSSRRLLLTPRSLAILTLALGLTLSLSLYALSTRPASADTPISLALTPETTNLSMDITKTGGAKSFQTPVTITTGNYTGYTLSAKLASASPDQAAANQGITISLSGGDLSSAQPLTTTTPSTPLTVRTTSAATAPSGQTTNLTLSITADHTATPGQKQLTITYTATNNPNQTIQSFTSSQCQALPTYTGSNEAAVITLNDPRGGGAGQNYQVAKLADGNCWMLNNLKLGSTTSSIALTSADTNLASGATFTLPQLATTGTMNADTPGAYGPIPGDTSTGPTNYGYLYNFPAATAGETTTTLTTGHAAHDICPTGWRLPKGGANISTYEPTADNEFNELNARMAGFPNGQDTTYLTNYDSATNAANWLSTGPFKGTLAGYWAGAFGGQGAYGLLWSASAVPGNPSYAFNAVFDSDVVNPGVNDARGGGFAVRCLVQ